MKRLAALACSLVLFVLPPLACSPAPAGESQFSSAGGSTGQQPVGTGGATTESTLTCTSGQSDCGGTCVSLIDNSSNCGACGIACAVGSTCTAGACSCQAGLTECGGQCADLGADPLNCGVCGLACGASLFCSQGACTDSCASGETECAGACIADLSANNLHCGSCGNACENGQACTNGACSCPVGQIACEGACVAAADGCQPISNNGGDGFLVDDECYPACPEGVASDGGTDFGFAQERSCIIPGSTTALASTACEPAPIEGAPEPGDGYYLDGSCHPPCASDATDADEEGLLDGWGYEQGRTCVVIASEPAAQGLPCIPEELTTGTGDGFEIDTVCYPPCSRADLADDDGWGYEHQRTCIAPDSTASLQGTPCEAQPLDGAPEPGDGFYTEDEENGGECHPACENPADADADGWGYEKERSCIVADSDAALQALPCIPSASSLSGNCPATLTCPNVQGEIDCGCTWIEGIAERKAIILSAISTVGGGNADLFLASAMMETETLVADYTPGDGKSGDSYNLGLAKQNWSMIRQCHSAWSGLGADAYSSAFDMNSNEELDARVYKECRDKWGADWWGGHRAGQIGNTGLDVQRFQRATEWTNEMLQDGHLSDDVRFWVDIPPI